MTIEWRYCRQCGLDKPASQVVANRCLQCRAEAVNDERPVTAIVAGLMFRQAKPQRRKVVAVRGQEV